MSSRPARVRDEAGAIPGPAGLIELRYSEPVDAAVTRCAVICHPHPLFGGTMENKVVTTLVRAASRQAAATVRFNFRGVGASEGRHDAGVGEIDDAMAVVDWALARWQAPTLWLCGFSFGASVALAVASRRRADRLVTVAPPVGRMEVGTGIAPPCPWLIVQGDADELVDARAVAEWAQGFSPQPRLVVMPGVTHFFHGRLSELAETVAAFLG